MKTKYLILGATGSIGFAFAQEIIKQKTPVTLLVRNKEKAIKLFGTSEFVEVLEGDVMDIDFLKSVSRDKEFIFHGINYPYDQWDGNMPKSTENIIKAASQQKSTVIFPGNIYEFGNVKTITDEMVPQPTTKKGRVRLDLFDMLKSAADQKKCKVIFMRLPDFFGPNVVNGLTTRIFGNAINKKPVNWLIRSDIPHQFVYTPDAAALMYQICLDKNKPDFTLYNFGGFVVPSVNEYAKRIATFSGGPSKVQNLPKFVMNLMGLFMPVMKELRENYYLFENTVILDDAKIRAKFPEFNFSSLDQAVNETLDWFRENT